MVPSGLQVLEFLDDAGDSPFAAWFEHLDPQAAAKVTVALLRLKNGNVSNVKSVGGGVEEYRIDWGPGYRIYLGRHGSALIILLCGGTKRRQQRDIIKAHALWAAYKQRMKE